MALFEALETIYSTHIRKHSKRKTVFMQTAELGSEIQQGGKQSAGKGMVMSKLGNKTFYPITSSLAGRMIGKIKGEPERILEPSAGKGDFIEYLEKRFDRYRRVAISAIEIDEDLQATLRGKGIKVIDTDFLAFSGPDKFDLIIANPPFDEGDKHLLKAIEIMYRGQILFLLNAETIRNPYTNIRKDLAKKLEDLGAVIEFVPDAFKSALAERPTGVEVALVNIVIERTVEDDLFAGANDKTEEVKPEIENNYELSTGRAVEDLVAEYDQIIKIGIDTIVGYFRNYKKVGKYIALNEEPKEYRYSRDLDMTGKMQSQVDKMLAAVRTDFWRRTLDLKEVNSRLTAKKCAEFESQITRRCDMDFTASNIRQFVLNLLGSHEKTLTEAVLEIFDMFTIRHCYSDGLYDENVHFYNGWKTNKAFKVGKKVIIPIYGSYGSAFHDDLRGRWKLNHRAAETLSDVDVVMSYFDGMMPASMSISRALDIAFECNQTSKIRSTYFTITVYKKGTIHLTFNSDDILRRFNVAACLGKQWLPHDYGRKAYKDMAPDEQTVAESFEGEKSYNENVNRPVFAAGSQLLRLTA
jgi:hypothetical protein